MAVGAPAVEDTAGGAGAALLVSSDLRPCASLEGFRGELLTAETAEVRRVRREKLLTNCAYFPFEFCVLTMNAATLLCRSFNDAS